MPTGVTRTSAETSRGRYGQPPSKEARQPGPVPRTPGGHYRGVSPVPQSRRPKTPTKQPGQGRNAGERNGDGAGDTRDLEA
eukprot:1499712-Prorocentrum_lima.AAC.1